MDNVIDILTGLPIQPASPLWPFPLRPDGDGLGHIPDRAHWTASDEAVGEGAFSAEGRALT